MRSPDSDSVRVPRNGRINGVRSDTARQDIGQVFEIWKSVHGSYDAAPPIPPDTGDLSRQLSSVSKGAPAQLALAACWNGLVEKTDLGPVEAMQHITSMLSAIAHPESRGCAHSLASVAPHARRLLATPQARAAVSDAVKDTFKSYTLAVLELCTSGGAASEDLLAAARDAFACRPYWFMMALTDALERPEHPALPGAVRCGQTLAKSASNDDQSFLAVIQRNASAANQVAMLLRSCMQEVRSKGSLADSLQVMTRLDAQLTNPDQRSPQHPDQPARTDGLAGGGRASGALPSQPPRESQPSAAQPVAAERPGTPGTAHNAHHGSVDATAPAADARADGAARGRSSGRNGGIEVTQDHLTADFDGDPADEGVLLALVDTVVRVTRLSNTVGARDFVSVLKGTGAKAVECVEAGEFLIQFEGMAAAVHAFAALPAWLEQAGLGRPLAAFASGSHVAAGCVWVPHVASQAQYMGVLKVLHHEDVAAPQHFALISNAAVRGCLLEWANADDAKDARHALVSWLDGARGLQPMLEEQQRRRQDDKARARASAAAAEPPAPSPSPPRTKRARSPAQPRPPRGVAPAAAQSSRHTDGEHASDRSREQRRRRVAEAPGSVPASAPAAHVSPREVRSPTARVQVFWEGSLAKSAAVQSNVRVTSANAVCRAQSRLWPQVLDMQHRMAIEQVVALWHAHDPQKRGWCWMHPAQPGVDGFAAFVAYLTQRQRAGIVKPQLAADGVAHTVYLVPATQAVCESLAIPFEADALLALVLEYPV